MSLFKNNTWQYFLPQHLLSRGAGLLANCDYEPVKNFLIEKFIKQYKVDMSEALIQDIKEFDTFNEFFTRELKPDARPIDMANNSIVSPADGTLSEFGHIQDKQLLQAKGQLYSLEKLLGNRTEWVNAFDEGCFATIYLAPKDYHRVHMPLAGTLLEMIHVPGKLFSVNQQTTQDIPNIFARNERVICIFETACGPIAVILVGAMIVASIATTWHGQVTPKSGEMQQWNYQPKEAIALDKGAEMGRFYLGSTAIILSSKDSLDWSQDLAVGQSVKMGQILGKL